MKILIIVLAILCLTACSKNENKNMYHETATGEITASENNTRTEVNTEPDTETQTDSKVIQETETSETTYEIPDTESLTYEGNSYEVFIRKEYDLAAANALLTPHGYTPVVSTTLGPERYAFSILDNNGKLYRYDAKSAGYVQLSSIPLEEKNTRAVALAYISEGKLAAFLSNGKEIIMYLTEDEGANWERQVVFSFRDDVRAVNVSSALVAGGQIYIGISSYSPISGGCVSYIMGTLKNGFDLVNYHIENHEPTFFETEIERNMSGLFLNAEWRENDGVTHKYSYKLPMYIHKTFDEEIVEKSEDGTYVYADDKDAIVINPDMHIISWNGVEAEFDFDISITPISISNGMDIDGDGNSEHILCYLSGARCNPQSVILDLVEDDIILTLVEKPSELGEYTLYPSDTVEYKITASDPIYFEGYEWRDLFPGTYRKEDNYFDTVTKSGLCAENGSLQYSDENDTFILCFPLYPGPISGMAGAGIEVIVLYKYTDGNLEVVGYEY